MSKRRFSQLSIKVGMIFSHLPLTPNQWTLFSFVPAVLSSWFIINGNFLLAALLFGAAAFFDVIDGAVARVTGRVTKRGAYLDTVVDRYIEGIVIFGLLFASLPLANSWIFLYLFGSMMTTYSKAAAKEKGLVDEELRGGFAGRTERLILLFLGLISAIWDRSYLAYAIIILAVLTNATALQRVYMAMKRK